MVSVLRARTNATGYAHVSTASVTQDRWMGEGGGHEDDQVVLAWVQYHVLVSFARLQEQGSKWLWDRWWLWEIGDATWNLLLLLVVSTTRKTALLALLALLTHAFFVRWVRPLSDALLKADVKRRGGSEDKVKGRKERGKKFSRRMQIFGACPLTDRVDLRQPSHTSSTHTL